MKRLCVLLILCSLLLSTACGSGAAENPAGNESGETTAGTDTTEQLSERETVRCSLPEDLKFEGKKVNVLVSDDEKKVLEVWAEQTGDVVEDAVFNRNLAVSENTTATENGHGTTSAS